MNAKEFADKHDLSLECTRSPVNPNMVDGEKMNHWHCVIQREGFPPTSFFYSMGQAHRVWNKHCRLMVALDKLRYSSPKPGERYRRPVGGLTTSLHDEQIMLKMSEPKTPDLDDVLPCLAMDCQMPDQYDTVGEWAAECGFTDIDQANSSWAAVAANRQALRRTFGPAFGEFLTIDDE